MESKEVALVTANANLMLYDNDKKAWITNPSGISRIQVCHHPNLDSYRFVGWDLNNRQVVLNSSILHGMKYQQARQTFHQWRDPNRQVYGLNFTSPQDAQQFGATMDRVLHALAAAEDCSQQRHSGSQQLQMSDQSNQSNASTVLQKQQQPQQFESNNTPQNTTAYQEKGSHTVAPDSRRLADGFTTVDSAETHAASRPSNNRTQLVPGEYALPRNQSSNAVCTSGNTPAGLASTVSNRLTNGAVNNGTDNLDPRYHSSSDDSVKGIMGSASDPCNRPNFNSADRTVRDQSASPHPQTMLPKIPPPPPLLPSDGGSNSSNYRLSRQQQRAADVMVTENGDDDDPAPPEGSLAAQLRAARQLRTRASSVATGSSEPSPAASVGRTTGLDMMSDLQRVLAERRKAKEVGITGTADQNGGGDAPVTSGGCSRTVTGSSVAPGFATLRKNSTSALSSAGSQLSPDRTSSNRASTQASKSASSAPVSLADLEAFKRELMSEFRREVQQLKNDVIEALRTSVNRTE